MTTFNNHTLKDSERTWERPCDPRPLWYVANAGVQSIKSFVRVWFAPKARVGIEVYRPAAPAKKVLTPAEVHERSLRILRAAEEERERLADREARVGISFE